MATDVDRLLAAVPIENYIHRFVPLKSRGNNFLGLCPFHNEKTPSFTVSPEKGIFKCFGCGKGGNLISFITEYEKISFKEALQVLSEISGIELTQNQYRPQTKNEGSYELNEWVMKEYLRHIGDETVEAYLRQRGILKETRLHFKLGYAPESFRFLEDKLHNRYSEVERKTQYSKSVERLKELGLLGENLERKETYNRFRGRLMFPIIDVRGRAIGFGGRLIKQNDKAAKYVNSPDSSIFKKKKNLYNLYFAREAIRAAGQAIIVEGYIDCIGLYQAGIKNTVAPLGTAFTEEQAVLLKRYTNQVVAFFDGDQAGTEAAFKTVKVARKQGLNIRVVVQKEGGQDPFDLSQSMQHIDLLTLLDDAKSEADYLLWYFLVHKFNIQEIFQKKSAIKELFQYIMTFEEQWEKEDFLKLAAKSLNIEYKTLVRDYNAFHKKGDLPQNKKKPVEGRTKDASIPRLEREIMALLLRFPDLWQNEVLLKEMHWQSEEAYLLYSFFRDRLRTGESWSWAQLPEVMLLLPESLNSLLSGIILDFEKLFDELIEEEKKENKWLTTNVLQHKINYLQSEVVKLQDKLLQVENLNPDEAQEITESIEHNLNEKNRILEALHD